MLPNNKRQLGKFFCSENSFFLGSTHEKCLLHTYLGLAPCRLYGEMVWGGKKWLKFLLNVWRPTAIKTILTQPNTGRTWVYCEILSQRLSNHEITLCLFLLVLGVCCRTRYMQEFSFFFAANPLTQLAGKWEKANKKEFLWKCVVEKILQLIFFAVALRGND